MGADTLGNTRGPSCRVMLAMWQVEGPEILAPKMLKLVVNKSPKGHKKAKYKWTLIEYSWPGGLAIWGRF